MIPARHASRRASPAEIRQPVSVTATPSPDIRASMPMVTTSVNGDPFRLGRSDQVVLTSSINPCPSNVACGQLLPGLRVQPALPDPPRRR